QALPLVGTGTAYEPELLVGPRRALPAGGLTLHHPRLLLQDVRAGIVGLTLRQASFLARQRPGAVLVVGDAFAQLMASLVRAPRAVLQPLVSIEQERPIDAARLNRYFMESIRAPERFLLSRARRVYTRDEATAAALRARGVSRATFVGNPIMDGLDAEPAIPRTAADDSVVIGLLPGSRGYAYDSVERMVQAVDELSALVEPTRSITALVPWTLPHRPGPYSGWSRRGTPERYCGGGSVVEAWAKGRTEVWWIENGFASVLATADAVLGTSGTANEQAAGL